MRRTSSATLELPEDTLVILSFNFLFTGKPTPACPLLASEWYSRWPLWRVVKLSSFLRTSLSPITSHFMLYYFSSSSSSCTCSSFSNVLTLYVAIFSRSPIVWWFFFNKKRCLRYNIIKTVNNFPSSVKAVINTNYYSEHGRVHNAY